MLKRYQVIYDVDVVEALQPYLKKLDISMSGYVRTLMAKNLTVLRAMESGKVKKQSYGHIWTQLKSVLDGIEQLEMERANDKVIVKD
jgi:hypothetical protein